MSSSEKEKSQRNGFSTFITIAGKIANKMSLKMTDRKKSLKHEAKLLVKNKKNKIFWREASLRSVIFSEIQVAN